MRVVESTHRTHKVFKKGEEGAPHVFPASTEDMAKQYA